MTREGTSGERGGSVESVSRYVAELKIHALGAVGKETDPEVLKEARELLDYSDDLTPRDRPQRDLLFIDTLLMKSVPFIQGSKDPVQKHRRLLGVAHLLVFFLKDEVAATEDELVTSRFEDLEDRLTSLEEIEMANPSIDQRLSKIYEGLMELAVALGMTSCGDYCV